MRKLNIAAEVAHICDFIRDYTLQNGFENIVIGMSGGIDSALSATLAVKALGKEHVFGVMLPYKHSNPNSENDAKILAEWLQIQHQTIDISFMADEYFDLIDPDADPLRKGNWKARSRMIVLYDLSAKYKALVLGTSNRTELMVGYFTQHGDGACAMEPIGNIYKTEVWEMSRYLDIPQRIIDKTPTADLWDGQTDEGELGISYKDLDEILYALTEENISIYGSEKLPYPIETYEHVAKLISNSEYKRNLPPTPDGVCSI